MNVIIKYMEYWQKLEISHMSMDYLTDAAGYRLKKTDITFTLPMQKMSIWAFTF